MSDYLTKPIHSRLDGFSMCLASSFLTLSLHKYDWSYAAYAMVVLIISGVISTVKKGRKV